MNGERLLHWSSRSQYSSVMLYGVFQPPLFYYEHISDKSCFCRVVSNSDNAKVTQIINQLCLMFTSPSSALHARNGGLIGLAATAIALGQEFAQWLSVVIPRVLGCFADPESRVRYYACESLYNIAKVCKGEILVHFNGIFDALSKVSSVQISLVHLCETKHLAHLSFGVALCRFRSICQERSGAAGPLAKGHCS